MKKTNRIFILLIIAMFFSIIVAGTVAALDTTVISPNKDVNLTVSNDNGAMNDIYGNDTYNFFNPGQSSTQGQNELHISASSNPADEYGNIVSSNNTSGTFYVTNTGGRGWDDDIILMVAVNGTISSNFAINIITSGYTWTPVQTGSYPPESSLIYQPVALNETFYKSDFKYGPQIWKPAPGLNNYNVPIFYGQNMADSNNTFTIMFVDLYSGNLKYAGYTGLVDNGALKVQYNITGLNEGQLLVFNGYGFTYSSNQGQGIRWTNRVENGNTQSSGYTVTGVATTPVADFSADTASGVSPLTVHFTDNSTGGYISWAWDFNNDGVIDSTEQNPFFTYNTAGKYTVKLNVTNSAGSDDEIKIDYIDVTLPLDTTPPVPSADPNSGLYNSDKIVNLSVTDNQDPNPRIYYTLDNSSPTTSSTLYSGPITINFEGTTFLKFIAADAAGNISDIVTRTYNIDKTKPTLTADPSGGNFDTSQTVTLTVTDLNITTTYYTTDGSDPQSSSTRIQYNGPINVNGSLTLKYAALDAAGNWSSVYSQIYIISKPVQNTRTGTTYNTIQSAIDAALDGDTIKVGSGTYTENITVDKRLSLLAQGLVTVTALNPNNPVFNILSTAVGSIINGFKITGASNSHGIAIAGFCNITNNTITANGLDGIYITGGNPDITINTITGNGRDGISLNSGIATINFNRILNNTRYGLYMVSAGAVEADATYNWWGSNNPTYVINGANPPVNGTNIYDKHNGNPHVDYNPWIVFTVTSSPNSISCGANSTVTADLIHDNNGHLVNAGQIPDGSVINFNSDFGTIKPANSILTGNSATSILTAGNSSGTAHISVTVDGYTTQAQVIIDTVAPTVTANPAGGTFNSVQNVVLTTTDVNTTITYYTTDGSDPKTSGTRKTYSGPVLITGTTTLRYIAVDQAGNWSQEYTQTYTINNPDVTAPTVSADPKGGTYNTNQTVRLSATDDRDSNPKIYYTTDGTTPTANSTLYSSQINLTNGTTTIKFIAVDASNNISIVFTETYNIDTIVPDVAANPLGGTFNTPQSVILSSTDSTAIIYYTTDGSDPKNSSARIIYTSPIQINNTTTLKYIAVDPAGNWSTPYSQTYTINKLLTVISTNPSSNATDISTTSAIVIKFNKNIVTGSNYSGIYVKNLSSGNTTLITKTLNGDTLTILQTNSRYANTWYEVYIPVGALKDIEGRDLASAFTYKFQTDKTPPFITSATPANMANGISLTAPIIINFSENIVAGANYSGIYIKNLSTGNTVGITKTISGNTLTITQTLNRINNNQYIVYLPVGAVKDAAGNSLDSSYSSQFQTGTTSSDKTPPNVSSTSPGNNATGISLTSPIIITFSENISAGTNYSGIYIKNLSTGNTVGITKTISGNTLTITQTLNRINNNQYIVYLPVGAVKDASGNSLAVLYSFQFQTGTTITDDKTSPTVTSTSPTNNATVVSLTSAIIIKFSENINIGANYSGIYVKNLTSGKIVGITKSISGNTLTIQQTSCRLHNNTYQVYITANAVKDAAGNNLTAAYTYQFRTG